MEASSVTTLVNEIKKDLENQFRGVSVVGEVSNLSSSGAGHFYFTLSDSQSSLSACLFKMDAMRNPLIRELKDGDKIIASGSIGVYARRGTFQLVAKRIVPAGAGNLKQELERLKKRLASEGLFDLDVKKAIPRFPKRIGLITAYDSAAYHDFVNVFKRRSLWTDILVSPALVQGKNAPQSIKKALYNLIAYHQKVPEDKKLDVIVLSRGGGSLEDLWSFNDEALAWEIYNCPIPTISAVGHEVDYSISDFVADKRCETPTAAAEVLSAGQMELKKQFTHTRKMLKSFGSQMTHRERRKLERLSPIQNLRKIETRLYHYQTRLERCKINKRLPEFTGLHDKTLRLEECWRVLKDFPRGLNELNKKVENQYGLLRLLNPDNILGRGYAYVKDPNGKLVGTTEKFDEVPEGSELNIHFSDGMRSTLKKKEDKSP